MSRPLPKRACAYAPASIGNVAVGFDILGMALDVCGDRVTVWRIDDADSPVLLESISGIGSDTIPLDVEKNTAAVALTRLIKDRNLPFAFGMKIEKGIPMSSGMGGSAASAAAAVTAADALLETRLTMAERCLYATAGEQAASGAFHADNTAPSLYGGLCLVLGHEPPEVLSLPTPDTLVCALVRPHLQIATKDARAILTDTVPLRIAVEQSALLAGFIAGCYTGDVELMGRSLRDVLIEPQRKSLIPGFDSARAAALENGALGFSISGAGPSVFALCENRAIARIVADAVVLAFDNVGLQADSWVAPTSGTGARVIAVDWE